MSVSQLPQKYIAVGEVVKIQKRKNILYDIIFNRIYYFCLFFSFLSL